MAAKNVLLVASRKGLFVLRGHPASSNNEWKISAHHFEGEPVTQVLVDPRDGAWYVALRLGHFGVKLKKSSDQGATWIEVAAPMLPSKPTSGIWADDVTPWSVDLIWSFAAGGVEEPGTLWAGCMPAGLFKSLDSGTSWQLMESLWFDERRKEWFGGGNDHPGIHSIIVDPRDSQHVTIAISCGGVWHTLDGGKNWMLIGEGLSANFMPPDREYDPNIQDPHAVSACAQSPDIMWMQHHAGSYRSADAGRHWQRLSAPLKSDFGFPVVADPENPDRAWLVPAQADIHRYAPNGAMCVARTDDAGKTWQILRHGLPQQNAFDLVYRHSLALTAIDGNTLRMLAMGSTTGSLWLSVDSGEHWQTISNHFPPIASLQWSAE